MSVVDRDYGERPEDYEVVIATGLCVICREDQALPDDELCEDCLADISREPKEEE